MSKSPRILLYDVETSHSLAAIFQLANNDYINPENLIQDRHMVCAAWKWLDEDKVYAVSVLDDPKRFVKDHTDDYHVVKTLHEVMSQADVVVGHNSDRFDHKFSEARMAINGLPPLPPLIKLDTLKTAKDKFLFSSNKLDFIGRALKVGKKMSTTPGLWLEVLKGSKSAIKEMVAYNKGDVLLLEKVFLKLRPYMGNAVNLGLFNSGEGCPRCGSKKVQRRGLHRAISRVYQRFQCLACGGWHRSVLNDKSVKPSTRVL